MPKRVNKPNHDDKTKKLIRASMLLNRLADHAEGKVEMNNSQVNAAKVVIGKSIPDLRAIELTGEEGKAMKFEIIKRVIVDSSGN